MSIRHWSKHSNNYSERVKVWEWGASWLFRATERYNACVRLHRNLHARRVECRWSISDQSCMDERRMGIVGLSLVGLRLPCEWWYSLVKTKMIIGEPDDGSPNCWSCQRVWDYGTGLRCCFLFWLLYRAHWLCSLGDFSDAKKIPSPSRKGWFLRDGKRVEHDMNVYTPSGIQRKGMESILKERGLWRNGLIGHCKTCASESARGFQGLADDGQKNCRMRKILLNEPDFLEQKPLIEECITSRGHICVFYPKFHCELNFIELFWGYTKRKLRAACGYFTLSFASWSSSYRLLETICRYFAACSNTPLGIIVLTYSLFIC